jgi:hypothetical protein
MKLKSILTAAALALCAGAGLHVFAAGNPMDAQPDVVRGAWTSSFADAKAYADKENIPMLVFWASPGCSQCEKLESACKGDDFKSWMAEMNIVFVFGYGVSDDDAKACKAFVKNSTKEFPYMGVCWKENTHGQEILEKFTGRSGKMGVSSGLDLDEQLMLATSQILADWDPNQPEAEVRVGGSFTVPNTENSHLEAIAGVTKSVAVPLFRTNATCVVTNVLAVGEATQTIVWDVGESEKSVMVDTSVLAASETLALALSLDDEVVETSAIRGVEDGANAPKNPKTLGESFSYGEWTLDYGSARSKAAQDADASLLVMFSGPLWCPYCIGIEDGLLNTDEFRRWAENNKVYLVLMEQGRATSPATAMGERGPRLTTYDHDPKKLANGEYVSGAAYRSRKGVTEAQATTLMNQTATYTTKWLEPGSTSARCGNPTILLIDAATETVCARFNGYRAGTAYALEENLARLDELLKKNGSSEANRYPLTTALTHVIGATNTVSLDVNEASASYRFTARAGEVSYSMPAKDDHDYTFGIYTNGTGLVASGVNGVTYLATPTDVKAGLSVKISTTFASGERTATASFTSAWRAVDTENEFVSQAFTTSVTLAEDGTTAGTLTIKSTKKGKVSASYYNAATGKTTTFSGYWSEPDEIGTAVFAATKYSGAMTCRLEMSGSGEILASVEDSRTAGLNFRLSGDGNAAEIAYEDFAGYYTVALPVSNVEGTSDQYGSGYVLVKANSAVAKKYGRVTCTVFLPNGTSKTATAQMSSGADGFANLTVTIKSGYETIIIPLSIRPNAALSPTHRAVIVQPGCSATWVSRSKKTPFSITFGVYGSRYDKKESLVDCCGTSELVLAFEKDDSVASILGESLKFALTDRKIVAEERISKFSLSFSRTSGIVSGKTRVTLADGSTVSAKLRGALFLDWYDCGCFEDDDVIPLDVSMAHIFGTCYFTSKVDGKTVKRSIPFSLKASD